ncbi:MAG TPA: hypothetical protein VGD92_07550 [Sphingobacteriaceae bacterium]
MSIVRSICIKSPRLLVLLFAMLAFSSCEREMTNEIISTTPPELQVVVHQGADKTVRVEGATVQLYASEADRGAGTNIVSSAVTNSKGEAIFTQDKFRKGVMYVRVSKAAVTVDAATPYLLQNDGKTMFWVSL